MSGSYILGIDEVGRGCLAGPVMLGGVLLSADYPLLTNTASGESIRDYTEFDFVRDSKKLTEKKRILATALIPKYQLFSQVLQCSNTQIDEYGIGVCLSYMVSVMIGWTLFVNNISSLTVIIDGKLGS
jgi:ribonuclease HII